MSREESTWYIGRRWEGSIKIVYILGEWDVKAWSGLDWLRMLSCSRVYEHSNKYSCYIKMANFFTM
jgi:hypothetical protein